MNTTFWRNKVLDSVYQAASGNSFYIGLSSTAPTDAGGNVTEPSGAGYARVQISGFSTAANSAVHNTADIVFPTSTGTWFPLNAPATHWVMFNGSGSGAHVLSSGTLEEPIGIWKNTTVTIATGKVVITLTDSQA